MEEKDIQNQYTDNLLNTPSQDGTHKKHIKLSPKFIKVFLTLFVPIILLAGLFTYSKIQSLNKENVSLQKELDNTKKQYQEAQVDLKNIRIENDNLVAQYESVNSKLSELQSSYDTLLEENSKLKEENASLQSEIESLKAELEKLKQQPPVQETSVSNNSSSVERSNTPVSGMVWLTRTGEKYHSKPDCGRSNPNNSYQVTLSEAQSRGYAACKKCY